MAFPHLSEIKVIRFRPYPAQTGGLKGRGFIPAVKSLSANSFSR
jgi:hypothetical protein